MVSKCSFRGLRGLVVITGLLFLVTPLSLAQNPRNINWPRMQRDLDIMESVLNKLLKPSPLEWGLWKSKTQGVYLEGYGVVFQVDYSSHQMYVLSTGLRQAEKKFLELQSRLKGEDVLVLNTKENSEERESETFMAERLENLKEQLTEFLGNYADAIGQLDNTDRITVLVAFGRDNFFSTFPEQGQRDAQKQISLLEATVTKSNIIDFRRGRINDNEFRKRVTFRERNQDDDVKRNLDIMAEIMETALSKKYHNDFGAENLSQGIHLEGLGVLFFMKGILNHSVVASPIDFYVDEYLKSQEVKIVRKEREEKSMKMLRELLDEFKTVLVEVVGDYGHTLRSLKPTDYVVITVDFDDFWSLGDYGLNHFVMKAQKRDLDKYNRGEIKLAEFRKKVEFLEY